MSRSMRRRDAAILLVREALEQAGFTTFDTSSASPQYLNRELTVDFTVGSGRRSTPIHYVITEIEPEQ